MPAVEALAVGAPTLVADAGALPEVVGSAGVVLPVDEPMAWARTWSALLARPRAAAPVVAVACTATAMAAAMLGVWRAAAADGPGRGA